ncbi:hypothetical protein ES703_29540 [subsurface metagenome]
MPDLRTGVPYTLTSSGVLDAVIVNSVIVPLEAEAVSSTKSSESVLILASPPVSSMVVVI